MNGLVSINDYTTRTEAPSDIFGMCRLHQTQLAIADMKKRSSNHSVPRVVVFLVLALLVSSVSFGQEQQDTHQPYSSYWFIEDFLTWSPENDPHAKFNISQVELKGRFVDSTTQRNPALSNDPSIVSLVAPHPTSNHPSQGFQSDEQYAFPFWQYIDYFVQWGGSSGEGIIVTPALPWIESGHKNGVKVFGTVFFPPNVYGGKEEWVRALLQRDTDGGFPVANQLIRVAEYYGFDGWFINQETHGMGQAEADDMQAFLRYYQRKANGVYEVMWYDSMIEDGRIIWQDEFNDHNSVYFQQEDQRLSDIMFIDFGWNQTEMEDSHDRARALDRSPWELYAGIDVQARSYRTPTNWEGLYQNDKPYTTSIGLYWPNSTFDIAKNKRPSSVYAEEMKFWNGTVLIGDIPAWQSREWMGFAQYIPARSTLNQLPFVTHFNYGLGSFYNEEGRRLADREWHNLSNQDILPTWQWQMDTTVLIATIDFENSYTGGSCIRLDVQEDNKLTYLPLYKTSFEMVGNEQISMTVKGEGNLELVLDFESGKTLTHPLEVGSDWKTTPIDLTSSGRLVKIGVEARGKAGSKIYIGRLAVAPNVKNKPRLAKPRVTTVTYGKEQKAEVYLHFEINEPTSHYQVYQVSAGKKRQWLGQTNSADYYLPEVSGTTSGKYATIEVVGVAADGTRSKSTFTKVRWR